MTRPRHGLPLRRGQPLKGVATRCFRATSDLEKGAGMSTSMSPLRRTAGSRRSGRIRARLTVAALAAGFMVSFVPVAANADANSANTNYTVNGVGYANRAEIKTSGSGSSATAGGYTRVWPRTQTVGGGWVGARPRVFNASSGALACQGAIAYNTSPLSAGISFVTACNRTARGTWYSRGTSYGWTGSGYSAGYSTAQTPYQTTS